jgi:hypothetical protein
MDKDVIDIVFKNNNINLNNNLVFIGGSGAFVLKAICDDMSYKFPNKTICIE